uniref:Uncharacterized protein n=1 Tax=Anguilla anguilla TaxID=7936 RepID=A0A0E9SKC8_ANGAN
MTANLEDKNEPGEDATLLTAVVQTRELA